MRAIQFFKISLQHREWGSLALLAFVALVLARILLMPISPGIQRATIDRFHLTTSSFPTWAMHQVVPPMYNLENQFWFSRRPLSNEELVKTPAKDIEYGYINHFPVRKVTFAGSRHDCFQETRNGWLYLRSRYRTSAKTTVWRIQSTPNGTMQMTLVRSEFHADAHRKDGE